MSTPLKVRIGAAIWCVFTYYAVPDLHHSNWASALLLLAALVLAPMAWCLANDEADTGGVLRWRRLAMGLQIPAGVLLAVSLLMPTGVPAVLCALPWVVALMAMAMVGILRLSKARPAMPNLLREAGLIFAVIGGVWLLADRAGLRPLSFPPAIVMLTAVHFHYAGFVLPMVASLALALRPTSLVGRMSGWGIIVGVPMVAVGITATQLGWPRGLEMGATWVLVAASGGVAWLLLQLAGAEKTVPTSSRVMWVIAGVSLALGMGLAGLYGSRAMFQPMPWLDIPWMRALHGTLNALGFSMVALLGWCRAGRECCCGRTSG